jgi:hypothetical protein
VNHSHNLLPRASFGLKYLDGFVKSPFAALRFNLVVAEGRGGSPSRPISGAKHRAPTIETIVSVTFLEIIMPYLNKSLLNWEERVNDYPGPCVTLQSRVARRYEWRCEVKAKKFLGLGVRAVRLES